MHPLDSLLEGFIHKQRFPSNLTETRVHLLQVDVDTQSYRAFFQMFTPIWTDSNWQHSRWAHTKGREIRKDVWFRLQIVEYTYNLWRHLTVDLSSPCFISLLQIFFSAQNRTKSIQVQFHSKPISTYRRLSNMNSWSSCSSSCLWIHCSFVVSLDIFHCLKNQNAIKCTKDAKQIEKKRTKVFVSSFSSFNQIQSFSRKIYEVTRCFVSLA